MMNTVLPRISTIIFLAFLLSACQNGKKEDSDFDDDNDNTSSEEMMQAYERVEDDAGYNTTPKLSRAEEAFATGNYRAAINELLPLAQAGNPDAQYALGYLLYEGLGTPQDRMQAYFWIQEAARQGNTSALLALEIFEIDPNLPLDH